MVWVRDSLFFLLLQYLSLFMALTVYHHSSSSQGAEFKRQLKNGRPISRR